MDFVEYLNRGVADTCTGVMCVTAPLWISQPEAWLTPFMMWGGAAILLLRGAITVREWFRKK